MDIILWAILLLVFLVIAWAVAKFVLTGSAYDWLFDNSYSCRWNNYHRLDIPILTP